MLTVLQDLRSPQSRKKYRNVAVDKLATLILTLRHLFSGSKTTRQNSKLLDATSNDERFEWSYISNIKLDEKLYEGGATTSSQDKYVDGYCRTNFLYDVVKIESSIQYTDGATHRSIYDQHSRRVHELSSNKGRLRPPSILPHQSKTHVKGLSANLFGNIAMANGNYGHWLIDGLSRYFLLERFFDPENIDHFIVPPRNLPFHQEMLESLGITNDRVIELTPMRPLKFDKLLCTSSPRGTTSSVTPGWVIDSYRNKILPQISNNKSGKKIYVSRKDSAIRQLANEDELAEKLNHYGFETVVLSDYNFLEKATLFNSADVIVGLSGAGFANLMFCKENTRIVEIFPPDFLQYTLTSICSHLNISHDYHVLEAQKIKKKRNRYHGNQTADINKLISQLDTLLT